MKFLEITTLKIIFKILFLYKVVAMPFFFGNAFLCFNSEYLMVSILFHLIKSDRASYCYLHFMGDEREPV